MDAEGGALGLRPDALAVAVAALALAVQALLVSPQPSLAGPNEDLNAVLAVVGLARDARPSASGGGCALEPYPDLYSAVPRSMERTGTYAVAAPLFDVYGIAGLRLAHGLPVAVAVLLVYVVARRASRSRGAALLASALVALHPTLLVQDPQESLASAVPLPFHPNRALILLSSSLLASALLHDRRGPCAALGLGLAWGAACGVLELHLVLLPAALWRVGRDERALAAFACGALATLAPWMLWYQSMCGSVLVHPTQGCLALCDPSRFRDAVYCDRSLMRGFGGEGLVSVQRLGPWEFRFLGRLNIQGGVHRTPGYPFPTFLLIPLRLLAWLGLPLAAAALLGPWALRGRRGLLWPLALWLGAYFLLMAPQENWEWEKERLLLPLAPPVAVFLAAGLARLAGERRWVPFLAAAATLLAAIGALSLMDAPPDPGWYRLFPSERSMPVLYARERDIGAVMDATLQPRLLPAAVGLRVWLDRPELGELSAPEAFDVPGEREALARLAGLPEGSVVLTAGDVAVPEAASGRCVLPLHDERSPMGVGGGLDLGRVVRLGCGSERLYVLSPAPEDAELLRSVASLEGVGGGVFRLSLAPEARARSC